MIHFRNNKNCKLIYFYDININMYAMPLVLSKTAYGYSGKVYINGNGHIYCSGCQICDRVCLIHRFGCRGDVYNRFVYEPPVLRTIQLRDGSYYTEKNPWST